MHGSQCGKKNPTFLSFDHQLVKDAIIFLVLYVQSAL